MREGIEKLLNYTETYIYTMPEIGFQEQQQQVSLRSSGSRAHRDASPDSVIFTLESNFSLFSSASASVDRCSFASDAHDHDSFASEVSLVIFFCMLCLFFFFFYFDFAFLPHEFELKAANKKTSRCSI